MFFVQMFSNENTDIKGDLKKYCQEHFDYIVKDLHIQKDQLCQYSVVIKHAIKNIVTIMRYNTLNEQRKSTLIELVTAMLGPDTILEKKKNTALLSYCWYVTKEQIRD